MPKRHAMWCDVPFLTDLILYEEGPMATKKRTTAARLRELMHYDPDTGVFTWLKGRARTARGSIAGYVCGNGYVSIKIDREANLAHRLAWLYMTGEWPKNDLDHRDRDRRNNRWSNLREASASLNQANTTKRLTNTSGLKGICFWPKRNKWAATIQVRGRRFFLGFFESPTLAHQAYAAAATEHFGEYARLA